MGVTWICIDCGGRQPNPGTCVACGSDPTLNLAEEQTRELMQDVELRLRDRRETWCRIAGVVTGMAVIFCLWTQHFWWAARGTSYPGIPFFMDQWLFMILIGFGVSKALEKIFSKQRFPDLAPT